MHFGGPVEHGRGFVLHTADYAVEEFEPARQPRLRDDRDGRHPAGHRARARGRAQALLALGYAGWGPGQLEGGDPGERLADRAGATPTWSSAPSDAEKWGAALRSISIDPRLLSAEGGRA